MNLYIDLEEFFTEEEEEKERERNLSYLLRVTFIHQFITELARIERRREI